MEVGARVECFVGDKNGLSYIGVGTYLGNVSIWMAVLPNGQIGKIENPEQKPDEQWMAHMEELGVRFSYEPTPKIRMDDETIRYGGHVFWQEIKSDPLKKIIVPGDYPY